MINVYAADPSAAVALPGDAVPVKAVLAPPDVYAAVRRSFCASPASVHAASVHAANRCIAGQLLGVSVDQDRTVHHPHLCSAPRWAPTRPNSQPGRT